MYQSAKFIYSSIYANTKSRLTRKKGNLVTF